ncbi:MAG: type II secretion system GspH family protein [Tenericutes bacterium]|nr:type II secretion system GspH family protein [Mycoplasmatota bacterium]
MKKGFTLVELIATLIILSVVAIIVVPNVYENMDDSKSKIKITQTTSIIDSAKEWSADHIRELSCNNDSYVFLKDLQSNGYIDDPLYQDTEGHTYNSNLFVLIHCDVIEADENNNENYKYTYTLYETNEKHLEYLASLYAQKNNVTSKTIVTLSDLLPLAHTNLKAGNNLKNIEDGTLINNASVIINYSNGNYSYTVTIN